MSMPKKKRGGGGMSRCVKMDHHQSRINACGDRGTIIQNRFRVYTMRKDMPHTPLLCEIKALKTEIPRYSVTARPRVT